MQIIYKDWQLTNKFCGKLALSLALPMIFDDILKVAPVAFFGNT